MNILHIHQDYPDVFPYPSTQAVYNLISSCEVEDNAVGHYVVSINRTSNPLKVRLQKIDGGIAIIYWCLPLPFLYVISLWFTAWFIKSQIKDLDIDFIHGHKMTTEGVLAYFISKRIKKPYVISIRGGTDRNNLNRFSLHNKLFEKVYLNASYVYWVSMWMKPYVERCIGQQIKAVSPLPNICIINPK